MNSLSVPPPNFLNYNNMLSKQLAIVVDIPGLDLLTSQQIFRPFEYGDPVVYGGGGIYGGMSPFGVGKDTRNQRMLLDLDGGSVTISQRLEPEQGRGSISTLNMSFVDKDMYMTQAVSSGPILSEILGAEVKIWMGYVPTSWPQDYFLVWRGRVGQVTCDVPGRITMQFVDPNVVRRQNIFYTAQTTVASNILISDVNINVAANSFFHEKVAGPTGAYDTNVKCYIKIEDEFIEYQQAGSEATGFGTNQFLGVSRGARGTSAAAHSAGATVDSFIQISGNAMDIACKIMMSGFGGPYLTEQEISAFVTTGDPTNPSVTQAFILPANVDAVRDLGITIGDYFQTTGAINSGNNITLGKVLGFLTINGMPNNGVVTDQTFTAETASTADLAVRSQFDVWPDTCGSALPGWEVDVQGFINMKNTYLSAGGYSLQFLINGDTPGKTFIESQILLPFGAYSLTRQGKISLGLTKPPIADQRTQTLTRDNIIDPTTIQVTRGVNNRKFFNEIDWTFDYDDTITATSTRKALNATSLNAIGISSVLPIDAQGARTSLGFLTIVADRENLIFQRYSRGSVLYTLKVQLGIGNQIEVGDVVILQDNGNLNIPNFSNGTRNVGAIYVEVINRSLDLKTGIITLQLEGGLLEQISDRYGTIAPSSVLAAGTTSSELIITESFGAIFPFNEQLKWTNYVGLKVRVHSTDYTTRNGTTVFTGFDPANTHGMLLSPALGFTPLAGDIVELAQYSTSSSPLDQAEAKLVHAFLDPSPAIVTGIDHFNFTVASGDAAKFNVGMPIIVHDASFTHESPETTVKAVVGTTITVAADLGFTPTSSMFAELLGFADLGQPYRLI